MARCAKLPVDDDRVFVLARDDIYRRGWTSGFMVRDRYVCAQVYGGFRPPRDQFGVTASWTAALKRLEKAGRLKRCQLQNRRGQLVANAVAFDLP